MQARRSAAADRARRATSGWRSARLHAIRVGFATHIDPCRRFALAPNDEATVPLILTLKMDDLSQERFDRLRRAHFPPKRNFLRAHLTLFHHLPGDRTDEVVATVEEACRQQQPMSLRAARLLFMGRGVAYAFDAPELGALRKRLTEVWEPWLTPQDRQGFRPHVTVQNKVAAQEARALHERLEEVFSPFEVVGEGLSLWRYVGGPWRPVGTYAFQR
jgi:2'-5' RNA ligase